MFEIKVLIICGTRKVCGICLCYVIVLLSLVTECHNKGILLIESFLNCFLLVLPFPILLPWGLFCVLFVNAQLSIQFHIIKFHKSDYYSCFM